MLNSSAMDIMYYTSPLYRDEVSLMLNYKGKREELNRLHAQQRPKLMVGSYDGSI